MSIKQWLNSKAGLAFHPRTWWFGALHWSCGGVIQSGPFIGVRYVGRSVGSNAHPKLLGTYEMELHECIGELWQSDWQGVIDVGAAEGYYAVGFASKAGCQVTAFEQNAAGRELLQEMVRKNGLEGRVDIRGNCEPEDLNSVLAATPEALVIMDVEGYETVLLGETTLPHLSKATILVEIHEGGDREVTRLITGRLGATHAHTEFVSRPRTAADFTGPKWMARLALQPAWVTSAMDESRGRPMTWLLFRPR